ncbi:MAG: glycosyltransferase [Alphaproteobacteria bacterium]|nr:glycosyltransferase [Alphaproteobacteria bacterium]
MPRSTGARSRPSSTRRSIWRRRRAPWGRAPTSPRCSSPCPTGAGTGPSTWSSRAATAASHWPLRAGTPGATVTTDGAGLVLVVPCFNEARRLDADAFLRALAAQPSLRLRFVDDGSTDDTRAVLDALAARAPAGRVQVQILPQNGGKAEAVRQGMLAALDGGPAMVGFWDADLATPLDAVPLLRDALEQSPARAMAIGARVRLLGRHITRDPGRHYGGRIIATLVSISLGLPVYDTQCGAKLFRAGPDAAALLAEPFLTRWLFDVELIARWVALHPGDAWVEGIVEVPLPRWEDVGGSKVTLRDMVRSPGQILTIHRHYRPRRFTRGAAR